MKKLIDIQNESPPLTPLAGFPGVYVLDLPVGRIKRLQDATEGEITDQIRILGEEVLRSSGGEPFEDLKTEEGIEAIGVAFLTRLMSAVNDHLSKAGDAGESGN